MISDTFTIDIPYVAGQSSVVFALLATIVVIVVIKWLIDILP